MATGAAYLEDVVLVDRCMGGERAAERELFRREQGRVHATLYRVLGSNRDMDDLLQETFLEVFRSLQSYRGEAKLSTWIDRIAVRVAYRYLAGRRPAALALETIPEPPGDDAPEERARAREGVRRLYAALAELSPAARVAFALFTIDGRSIAEVASLMGTTAVTAKLRIWRARRALERRAAMDPVLAEYLIGPEEQA